jgi:hypothetical protein
VSGASVRSEAAKKKAKKRTPDVGADTVEAVVRRQLANALGGRRGIVESAIPTVGFTGCYIASHDLRLSLIVGGASAVALLAARMLQRSSPQYVLNSIVGIGIAALFALRSGRAEDAFLPGILYNAGYAAVLTASIVTRWPLVGFLIGSVTGDPVGWRRDPSIVRLCSRLTWLLVIPCALRVIVQYPLWVAGAVGWLGVTKIVLGWPLQIAALFAMVWLLARGRTPVAQPAQA